MKRLIMGSFWYPSGYHLASWRHPSANPAFGTNVEDSIEFARRSEEANFDFIFLPDSFAVRGNDWSNISRGNHRYVNQFEPLTFLSFLAAHTKSIGLVGSATTTYLEPYDLSRKFMSLDILSKGRAGWNLVTSQNQREAKSFGLNEHPDASERYGRANEFVDIVNELWQSWDPKAIIADKEKGLFFDSDLIAKERYKGVYFDVEGPLNIGPSPQRKPLIFQAGSSDAGIELAARTADVVFTAQPDLEHSQDFYNRIKKKTASFNRNPNEIKVILGVMPFAGETHAEALDYFNELQSLIDNDLAISLLEGQLGEFDLSSFDRNSTLPDIPTTTKASSSRVATLKQIALDNDFTILELARHTATARGHLNLIGSGKQIANTLLSYLDQDGCDGFIFMFPLLFDAMDRFSNYVEPYLQHRLKKVKSSDSMTLRERLLED